MITLDDLNDRGARRLIGWLKSTINHSPAVRTEVTNFLANLEECARAEAPYGTTSLTGEALSRIATPAPQPADVAA